MRCACLRELCRTLLLGVPRLFPRPTATHRREGVNQPSFKRLAEDAGPEFADRGLRYAASDSDCSLPLAWDFDCDPRSQAGS